jgi:hypothetical protein
MIRRVSRHEHPEKKFGPFHHGLGVAIWLNVIHTDQGVRYSRSITIDPRRYRNHEGEWRNASSYRPVDLNVIILALERARDYCRNTPLPGPAFNSESWSENLGEE